MKELKGSEYKRFEEIKHIREDGTEWILFSMRKIEVANNDHTSNSSGF